MTPAELYATEKAKHGVILPRATGCPRRAIAYVPERPRTEQDVTKRENDRNARWAEWRKLYLVDGMGLTDIAKATGYSTEGVRRGLRKMGVTMRQQGGGRDMARLIAENKHLKRENMLLRNRLSGLRRRQEAA